MRIYFQLYRPYRHEEIPPPPPPPPHTIFRSPFSYSVRFETNPPLPLPTRMPRCQRISSFVSLVPIQPETESPVPGYFWHSNNTDLICTMPLRANRIAECSFPRVKVFPLRIPVSCLLANLLFLLLLLLFFFISSFASSSLGVIQIECHTFELNKNENCLRYFRLFLSQYDVVRLLLSFELFSINNLIHRNLIFQYILIYI